MSSLKMMKKANIIILEKNQIKNIIAACIENLFFQNKEWAQNITILLISYNITADNAYLWKKHQYEVNSFCVYYIGRISN